MAKLIDLIEQVKLCPPRILVHGLPKSGKTTFATSAPSPIVLATEKGYRGIAGLAVVNCTSFKKLHDTVDALIKEDHDFKTVVLDSADWADGLFAGEAAKEHGKTELKEVGFGRAHDTYEKLLREFLTKLETLNERKKMTIVICCHSKMVKQDHPVLGTYDHIGLKVQTRGAAIFSEWADIIGLASVPFSMNEETGAFGTKTKTLVKRLERELYIGSHPAFTTGCRFPGFPERMSLKWATFWNLFSKYASEAKATANAAANNSTDEPTEASE